MNKWPHATEKSALHAFGSRMIVLCIISWCMLSYLPSASSTITSWTVNTHMHLLRIDHHLTRQSLCAEMASELRFAVRCGSRQRPAAKSRNSAAAGLYGRCSPRSSRRRTRLCSSEHEEMTYIPSIEIPRLNGVSLVPHDGHAIKFCNRHLRGYYSYCKLAYSVLSLFFLFISISQDSHGDLNNSYCARRNYEFCSDICNGLERIVIGVYIRGKKVARQSEATGTRQQITGVFRGEPIVGRTYGAVLIPR